MADSNTQIGNLALSSIGTRSTIASLQENSAEARAISLHYQPALNAVLRACHWNFARKQIALGLLQDATATPPGIVPQPWLYEYAYPSDCVQVRYVMPTVDSMPASAPGAQSVPFYIGSPVPFIVSSDMDAAGNEIKVILTNQPSATLVYTKRVVSPAMFDDHFTDAFAHYLGHRVCLALTGDKEMMKMAFQIADQITKEARATNGNEGLTVMDSIPDWMRVRGYSSDWAFPPGSTFFTAPQALTMIS